MKARELYEVRARELIKELRESQQVTHTELTKRLAQYGVAIKERVLINKLNRGTYSFSFAMLVMDALGAETLEIPKHAKIHPQEARGGKALTKADLEKQALKPMGK